jgi:hypothetical protein
MDTTLIFTCLEQFGAEKLNGVVLRARSPYLP